MTPKQASAAYGREMLERGMADIKANNSKVLSILKRLYALLAEKDVTKRTYYEEMALEGIDDAIKLMRE